MKEWRGKESGKGKQNKERRKDERWEQGRREEEGRIVLLGFGLSGCCCCLFVLQLKYETTQ